MGSSSAYVYNAVHTHDPKSPQKQFDPKAVTRASQTPKAPRKKQEGPLVSFNQHPDSFLILPYGNTNPTLMRASIKVWVKWMRIIQLVLRCLQVLCAGALLAFLIMIRGMDEGTGWILRIAPGIAILHTAYGIYHLSRRSGGRTPGSSASYMIFASLFDVSIIPFYAFSALTAHNHQTTIGEWSIILSDQSLTPTFAKIVFLVATTGGGLHLVSLAIGIYLAVTFRKITNLPPDMNPLEDNLTSRGHKRNKSSIYTDITGAGNRMSTATTAVSEKRLSGLESKRSSGATYQDLSRPPTIPFFHTRSNSDDSVSTYKDTLPGSRDSRADLPSRQYQALRNSNPPSSKDLKRSSMYAGPLPALPPKRQSYQEIPLSDDPSPAKPRSNRKSGNMSQGWYVSDSLGKRHRSESPNKREEKITYEPVTQPYDSSDDISSSHANPLAANPPIPRHSHNPSTTYTNYTYNPPSHSPVSPVAAVKTADIADMSAERDEAGSFKAKYYGDLKPATPPVMVGKEREVSSGNDFLNQKGKFRVRDASGKIAEEGLGGWGSRYRKVTGT